MTHPSNATPHDASDDTDDPGVSAGLRAALRDRPVPPPTWDLHAVKARGRRRRTRTRVLPVAAGLVIVAGFGVGTVATGASWPWSTTRTTATVAATVSGHPEQVVRDYLVARQAGDNARAFDDYWVPGFGARIDISSEPLVVDQIDIGTAEPETTGSSTGTDTAGQGWEQVVTVPVTFRWDNGPGLITGKMPQTMKVILVRNTDDEPWRILSSEESQATQTLPNPVVAITSSPESVARDAPARSGTVGWVNGCLVMDEALLVWPRDSSWDPVTQEVVLGDGRRVGIGASVETWSVPLGDLSAYLGPDGAAAIAACGGVGVPAGEVANGGRPVLEVSSFWG